MLSLRKLLLLLLFESLVFTIIAILSFEDLVHISEIVFLCADETNDLRKTNLHLPHEASDLVESGSAAAGKLWRVHCSDSLFLASPPGLLGAPISLTKATRDSLPPAGHTRVV